VGSGNQSRGMKRRCSGSTGNLHAGRKGGDLGSEREKKSALLSANERVNAR
jgi:hypothetical protein